MTINTGYGICSPTGTRRPNFLDDYEIELDHNLYADNHVFTFRPKADGSTTPSGSTVTMEIPATHFLNTDYNIDSTGAMSNTVTAVNFSVNQTTATNYQTYATGIDYGFGSTTGISNVSLTNSGSVRWTQQLTNTDISDPVYYILNNLHVFDKGKLKQHALKSKIEQQLAPTIITKKRFDDEGFNKLTPEEAKALLLLKSLIAEQTWRNYLKTSQLSVQGPSGLVYAITKYRSHILVFDPIQRRKTHELCINPKQSITPTDTVIMKLLLAQHDESKLWDEANVYPIQGLNKPVKPNALSQVLLTRKAA